MIRARAEEERGRSAFCLTCRARSCASDFSRIARRASSRARRSRWIQIRARRRDPVHLPHPEILRALEPGHTLLIDDGKVRLHVASCDAAHAAPSSMSRARSRTARASACPTRKFPVSPMTDKDRADLDAALEAGRRLDRRFPSCSGPRMSPRSRNSRAAGRLCCRKIEKPQAMAKLDEIVEISDGLMVARGDLGVEMPLEKVPGLQKRISRTARRLGKPVVVATQMLESMINRRCRPAPKCRMSRPRCSKAPTR